MGGYQEKNGLSISENFLTFFCSFEVTTYIRIWYKKLQSMREFSSNVREMIDIKDMGTFTVSKINRRAIDSMY